MLATPSLSSSIRSAVSTRSAFRYRSAKASRLQRSALGAILALAVAALGACAAQDAVPTPPADIVSPGVSAERDGVAVRIRTDAWKGEAPADLLPIEVRIENRGSETLRIHYSAFSVSAGSGWHAPIPAQQLAGQAALEAIESDLAPIGRPDGDDDSKAPVSARIQGAGPLDPAGDSPGSLREEIPVEDDFQNNYWDALDLDDERLYDQALREGELEPGESVLGYLYFSRADVEVRKPRFVSRIKGTDMRLVSEIKLALPFYR